MGTHIHLRVPTHGLVRRLEPRLQGSTDSSYLTVGATDQGFIPDAIKAAKDIGYKVIRLVFQNLVPNPTNILPGLVLGS